jgi:hypothetical protein
MAILGPNGKPMEFKKASPPKLGTSFGDWAGRDFNATVMPGGAVLQFDLSRLTLADYRAMRHHPQVNASLSGLTFMMHQIDWSIECKDKKIAAKVEANFRDIWTQLVRGMSQAFWAGYSPNALEYNNSTDSDELDIVLKRVKDLTPEDCTPNWKIVQGAIPPSSVKDGLGANSQAMLAAAPGSPPTTIRPKFKEYNGINQYGAPGPIPVEHSLWYPLLMENGNYFGRKLLNACFTPWYFSTLIHLFANRYYERFGEPTPVGRAPFDEEMDLPDGSTMTGKEIMTDILMNLRNRGSVTLPSDRSPVTKEFDYTIGFLESQMRGADFERYLTRLDEEISLGLFTPLLLMKSSDVGSNNLGVQHTQCVHPDEKILCADLVWRRAGDIAPMQEIITFDEDAQVGAGHGVNAREYRTGFIVKNIPGEKPSMKVTTDKNDPLTASVDHPWLVWRTRNMREHGNRTKGLIWVETKDLVAGDEIAYFLDPWDEKDLDTADIGWLSGIFDGEGSLCLNTSNHGHVSRSYELTVSQNEGPVLQKIKKILEAHNFEYSESIPKATGYGHGNVHKLRIGGGFLEILRFVGTFKPERFMEKVEDLWEERGLRSGMSFKFATVVDIEDVGMSPVASIQTSTGTFITNGYLTHNTWLWMLNAIAGDMAEYLTIIAERLKAINFGPNKPTCKWVPHKMGKENAQTIRSIAVELIRRDKAKVDIEEFGKVLGLSLEEVKELKTPEATLAPDTATPERDLRQRAERVKAVPPKTAIEPRATGREISHRLRGQVTKAYNEQTFGKSFKPDIGYRKRFETSLQAEGYEAGEAQAMTRTLYSKLEDWLHLAIDLGPDEFSSAADFMAIVDRKIDSLIGELVDE